MAATHNRNRSSNMAHARPDDFGASATPSANMLRGWIVDNSERHSEKTFVHSLDQAKTVSYGQLREATDRLAAYLAANDIKANDRIALLSNNSVEHLMTYLGVMAYGATICTIHVEMNAPYLADIIRGLRPRMVFHAHDLVIGGIVAQSQGAWHELGEWQPDGGTGLFAEIRALKGYGAEQLVADPTSDACVYFTSGTGATPKGVLLTFAEILSNATPTAEAFGITANDRILDYRSYNWASAQILSCLAPLSKGATIIMAKRFSGSQFFDWLRAHEATIAAGNPTILNILLQEKTVLTATDFPRLRFVTSSSAPLSIAELERFEARFGIPVAQGYGTSETGWIAGSNELTRRPGSVGKPLNYHRLAIVDDTGRALQPGEIGLVELGDDDRRVYRYLSVDGAMKTNAKGRILTNDLGYLDEDGYLFLTGRADDLIIRGGVNIAPTEIDGILLERIEVAEVATIGVPNDVYGEEPVSYVVVNRGTKVAEEDLLAHCSMRLAPFKVPKRILFRPSLPKTARGKMDRNALVEDWQSAEGASE